MTTTTSAIHPHSPDYEHSPDLAHHFDSIPQQYSSAKLGMWLFLATEILLFGGLFCGYAVFRGNYPEIFDWGSKHLNVNLGAINTVVLIVSSVTMAAAVTFAQMKKRWPIIIALSATFLCGVIFMAIKSVEYEHKRHEGLLPGTYFSYVAHEDQGEEGGGGEVGSPVAKGDAIVGAKLWKATCRSCHGIAGEGVTGQGRDIRTSQFIYEKTDLELLKFVKVGRMPFDKLNTTGIQMPPRGGNPTLTDADLIDIIAFVRSFHKDPPNVAGEDATETDPDAAPGEDAAGEDAAENNIAAAEPPPPPVDEEFYIPRSVVPAASAGPPGIMTPDQQVHDTSPPKNAHLYFSFYFAMTGLHGLHVLAGMGVIAWLIFLAAKGRFDNGFFTPVDLGGLYWHIVDLIWIFLFPLLYLIG